MSWRLCETDAAASHCRAERLVEARLDKGKWQTAHGACAAHRVHTVALRTFKLPGFPKEAITALIRSVLLLLSPGGLQHFKDALTREILEQPLGIVEDEVLSSEAQVYRDKALQLFAPSKTRSRARALVLVLANALFNSDWRCEQVRHICRAGCCESIAHTRDKVRRYVPLLVRSLALRVFCRDNWSGWPEGMQLVGLLSNMHGLFQRTFLRCFSAWAAYLPALEPSEEEDDFNAERRRELSQHAQVACSFWGKDYANWHLYVVRAVLEPQQALMKNFLALTTAEWEQNQVKQHHDQGKASEVDAPMHLSNPPPKVCRCSWDSTACGSFFSLPKPSSF